MYKFNFIYESLLNGLSKGKSIEDIAKKHNVNLEELKTEWNKGTEVETEHTSNKQMAKEIAKDHLFEDPKYYTKLAKMEKK
jgi:hypothetical protein